MVPDRPQTSSPQPTNVSPPCWADFGYMVMTAAIDRWINLDPVLEPNRATFVRHCLKRHTAGDFGDLDAEDRAENQAVFERRTLGRIVSAYSIPGALSQGAPDPKIWIITNGLGDQEGGPDYCNTTVLFPSDY